MPGLSLPLHEFSEQRRSDLPFEIEQIEDLPPIVYTALPHHHTSYEIFWIAEGDGSHSFDFENYPLQFQTLYFISPGQVHFWNIEWAVSGFAILFTEDFLPANRFEPITLRAFDFFHRLDHRPVLNVSLDNARPFDELCQRMLQEYRGEAYGRLTVLQSQLRILLVHAQRRYARSSTPPLVFVAGRLVEDYIHLIDLHFREHQYVHEVARWLGVTPGHLTDTTRERTGIVASQFIYGCVTLESKCLLAYSECAVAEIGYALNFQDSSYFTRFFRRECGMTPTDFG